MENDSKVVETEIDLEVDNEVEAIKAELESTKKALKTTEAQKTHWKNKALRKEEGDGENGDEADKPQPKVQESTRLDRIDLRLEGYSDKEVDFILKNGGKAALTDEFVKAGIDKIREQVRSEKGAIDDTSVGKSDIERKYTPAQLEAMSVTELEKVLTQK